MPQEMQSHEMEGAWVPESPMEEGGPLTSRGTGTEVGRKPDRAV